MRKADSPAPQRVHKQKDITLNDVWSSLIKIQDSARILIQRLEDLRIDEQFQKIFEEADKIGTKLNLEYPSEPRKNKISRRLEHCGNLVNNIHFSVKHNLKLNFFEALDRLTNELRSRFDEDSRIYECFGIIRKTSIGSLSRRCNFRRKYFNLLLDNM